MVDHLWLVVEVGLIGEGVVHEIVPRLEVGLHQMVVEGVGVGDHLVSSIQLVELDFEMTKLDMH